MQVKVQKIRSKLMRLKIRDDIADFLRKAPLIDMEENQVGNHIYSGTGIIRLGNRHAEAIIRVRMVGNKTVLYFKVPRAGIHIRCPFKPREAAELIRREITKNLN